MTKYLPASSDPNNNANQEVPNPQRKEDLSKDIPTNRNIPVPDGGSSREVDTQEANEHSTTKESLAQSTIDSDRLPIIEISPHKKLYDILKQLILLLKEISFRVSPCNTGFLTSKYVDGKEYLVHLPMNKLATNLVKHVRFESIRNGTRAERLLSTRLASCIIPHPDSKCLDHVKFIEHNGAFDANLRQMKHGFDPVSNGYLCAPIYEPLEGTTHIDDCLQDFHFKDNASRTNYVGCLLGLILYQHAKRQPLLCISADGPAAGKSHLAKLASVIGDNVVAPMTIGLSPSESEFEKSVGSVLEHNCRVVIIDNVKSSNKRNEVDSPVLDRITSVELISTRRLGSSSLITRLANILWILTTNHARLSPDLSSRCIPVVLKSPTGTDRTYRHANLLEYAHKHRKQFFGELMGMIIRWRDAGANPDKSVNHRESSWTQIIGGVLKANGYKDFLGNVAETRANQDLTLKELVIVVRTCMRNSMKVSCLDIYEQSKAMKLVRDALPPYLSDMAAIQKVQLLMRKLEGSEFEFEGCMLQITRHSGRNIYFSLTENEIKQD